MLPIKLGYVFWLKIRKYPRCIESYSLINCLEYFGRSILTQKFQACVQMMKIGRFNCIAEYWPSSRYWFVRGLNRKPMSNEAIIKTKLKVLSNEATKRYKVWKIRIIWVNTILMDLKISKSENWSGWRCQNNSKFLK